MVEIFLQPGELYFGDRHTRIRTLLGSCVSLVLWHRQRQIGGMCHYMLPYRPAHRAGGPDGRYGDDAVQLLLAEIRAANANPADFHVRLFGGGNMFPAITRSHTTHVGKKNVEAARHILAGHRMKIDEEHVEGLGHRHLVFDLGSGHVALRHVAHPEPAGRQLQQLDWAARPGK